MSSISGLGSSILQQYLQSTKGKHKASKTASPASAITVGQDDGDFDGLTQGVTGGQHGGRNGGSFLQQIQAAVTSTLQSAQSTGATSSPNQLIQNAIAQILKNQQNITTGAAAQADGTDTSAAANQGTSTIQSAFAQLLQSNGANAQQFQQNFLAAIQSAQNGGSSNSASVFSGLPTGSLIDTLA